jgi:hypothetical protein
MTMWLEEVGEAFRKKRRAVIWNTAKAVLWVDLFLLLLLAGRRLGIGPEIFSCIGTGCAYGAYRYRRAELQFRRYLYWHDRGFRP